MIAIVFSRCWLESANVDLKFLTPLFLIFVPYIFQVRIRVVRRLRIVLALSDYGTTHIHTASQSLTRVFATPFVNIFLVHAIA